MRWLIAGILCCLFIQTIASPAGALILEPDQKRGNAPIERVSLGRGSSFKEYLRIDTPCPLPVMGPGILDFYVRGHMADGIAPPKSVTVTMDGLTGFPPQTWTETLSSARKNAYADGRAGIPTGGKKITLAIPNGYHRITVTGISDTGAPVYARFVYKGPPVPEAGPPKKPSPWKWAGAFEVGTIYDDNICRYSDDTLELFQSNASPEKFAITNKEDVILNFAIQTELSRKLLFGKKTALRFRYQRWDYVENSIKTNDEINLRFRQSFRRSDYFEATYTYAPDSYIKELSDRPPFTSMSVDREYLHFYITRNAYAWGYNLRAKRWCTFKFWGGYTTRFYNRPFLENDLWEWNGRLETDLRWKRLTWNLRYAYATVAARGYDEVGETLETSDNDGDGSYEKDTYRLRLTYRPKKSPYAPGDPSGFLGLIQGLAAWVDRGLVKIKTSAIYLQFKYDRQFYTSERPLEVDPLHVGRLDEAYQWQGQWSSKALWSKMTLLAALRYTVRTAESPGGYIGEDPSEEKDYTGARYWLAVSRALW